MKGATPSPDSETRPGLFGPGPRIRAIGGLMPADIRGPLVDFGLATAALGGTFLLVLSAFSSGRFDATHPVLLLLGAMQLAAGIGAALRKGNLTVRSHLLLAYCFAFGNIVLVYVGPTAIASLLVLTCVVLSGLLFGRRAMGAMIVIEALAIAIVGILWVRGILPPSDLQAAVARDSALFWVQWSVSLAFGSATLCLLLVFLLRRLDAHHLEERRMIQYLAREQQLRAQSEVGRLQAEVEKRNAESEFGVLWGATPLGLSVVKDRTLLRVNQRMTEIYGYADWELVGHSTQVLYCDVAEYTRVGDELLSGLTAHGFSSIEAKAVRKDGTAIDILLTATPLTRGRLEDGYVVTCMDISHLKQAEKAREELEIGKREAEAASRAKSTFLANMSHEIRTPLNAILGFTQLLLRDPRSPEEHREQLGIIDRNGEHLLALINDILEISKIEANRVPVNIAPVHIGVLCSDIQNTFRLKAESKRLRWNVAWGPGVPRCIQADESKLRMVLINLVGNAIKFTARGEVALTVAVREEGRWIDFEVTDTGPGIAPSDQTHLFEPFMQTEVGRQAGGTGLGLAISRNYARLLGGDLVLTSPDGAGSRFVLSLPLQAVEEPELVPQSWARQIEGAPKVLVVDDVADNRLLLKEILERAGYRIAEAQNGLEAVQKTETWKPDCILMDMRMPVMDGPAAMREIRERFGVGIRILSLSASVFADDKVAYGKAGADGFISKPFREQDLLETLSRLLGKGATNPLPATSVVSAKSGEFPEWEPPLAWVTQVKEACAKADYTGLKILCGCASAPEHARVGQMREALQNFDYLEVERLCES